MAPSATPSERASMLLRTPTRGASSAGRWCLMALALAVTATTALVAAPAEAQAQTVSISVVVIHGSNNGGGTDGSLSGISGQLRSRFGQYDSFRQLATQSVSLSSGSSRTVSLPNGQSMTITFTGMSGSNYEIRVSLPGGGGTVTAPPGGIFFVAGPPYDGGEMIIAIRT